MTKWAMMDELYFVSLETLLGVQERVWDLEILSITNQLDACLIQDFLEQNISPNWLLKQNDFKQEEPSFFALQRIAAGAHNLAWFKKC